MDQGRAVAIGDKGEVRVENTTFIIPKDQSQVENIAAANTQADAQLDNKNIISERNNDKIIVASSSLDKNVVLAERSAVAAKLDASPQTNDISVASAAIAEPGASAIRTAPTDRVQDSASRAQDVETVSHSSNVAKESNVVSNVAGPSAEIQSVETSGPRESNSYRENKSQAEDIPRANNSASSVSQSQARAETIEERVSSPAPAPIVRAPDQPAPDVQAPNVAAQAVQNALLHPRESESVVVPGGQSGGPDLTPAPTRARDETGGKVSGPKGRGRSA